MKIAGQEIKPGESKRINVNIAKLPSGTLIDIPIFIHQSKKPGPVLLLIAGMHGDEINGVEIMRRIIAEKQYVVNRGSVICIPIINIYGFINFSRDVPDGKDINRSFPGSKTGSLASQVAHFLMEEIIPHIDYGIDFHTGGARINNYPQIRVKLEDRVNRELAEAFATNYIIDSPFRDKSLRKEAFKLDKRIIVYEAGESLRLRKNAIDEGINGMLRVMKYLEMIPGSAVSTPTSTIIHQSTWIRARSAGVHVAYARNGSPVQKQQVLGVVSDPYGDYETKMKSPVQGYIIGVNNNPVINRGDALFHIGY